MQFLILEYDYVTWKPRIINSMNYNSEQKYWDTNQKKKKKIKNKKIKSSPLPHLQCW